MLKSTKEAVKNNLDLSIEKITPYTDTPVGILPTIKKSNAIYRFISIATLVAIDAIGLALALTLAYLIRVSILPTIAPVFPTKVPSLIETQLWLAVVIALASLGYEGLYSKQLSFWREAKMVIKATTLAFIFTLAAVSLGKLNNEVSRTMLVLGYFISIILLPLGRLLGRSILVNFKMADQPVLILGAGKTGGLIAQALLRERSLGYRIIGFLDDDPAKRVSGIRISDKYFQVLGGFKDCESIMDKTNIHHLIIAAPGMDAAKMVNLVNRLQQKARSLTVIPDLFGVPVMGAEADYAFDEQILSFKIRNRLANPWNMAAKRLFDLVVGMIMLIVILPVMAAIAIAIRLDSPGPAIFPNRRIGKKGQEFGCFKFRTMYLNNEEILRKYFDANPESKHEWDKYAKLRDYDPRMTRIGKLLRKLSLDELPQIFNVLKGDMSLVGPRPYLPRESLRLSSYADTILMSRPGITGLWQVSGRNEIDFEGRLRLESWYVRNWSFWLDVTLLIRTISVVLARKGVY